MVSASCRGTRGCKRVESAKLENLFDITILMICLLLAQVEIIAAFLDGIVNAASHFAHSIGAMEVSS